MKQQWEDRATLIPSEEQSAAMLSGVQWCQMDLTDPCQGLQYIPNGLDESLFLGFQTSSCFECRSIMICVFFHMDVGN